MSSAVNGDMEAFHTIYRRLGLSYQGATGPANNEPFLFVSIDLEYDSKRITQLGISVFDSQTLESAGLQSPETISNEYPMSSTLYATKVCRYQERRRKRSHFGEKYLLMSQELQPLLLRILTPTDEHGYPRDVVLVGHNIASDLTVIERVCGLNINRDITSVKAVLDTQCISQSILESRERLSLKRLLIALDLEYIGLHNAAHDSRYTLRALLLMFCRTSQLHDPTTPAMSPGLDTLRRLALLAKIAKFHKPRERILWCNDSPRVKFEGNPDMLDREVDGHDIDDSGLLTGIV